MVWKVISRRACRGSGGVGILVKNSLLASFDVAVVSEKFDGILWVQLIHKDSKQTIGVCVCYLPPAGSSRGDQSLEFFDTLKALVIENCQVDELLICGDFNARCGDLPDSDPEDNIQSRLVTDKTINSAGRDLISCMRALDMFLLNGRNNVRMVSRLFLPGD